MSQGILMVDANEQVAVINRRALELLDLPETLMAERLSFQKLLEYQWRADEFGVAGKDIPDALRDYVQSGGLSTALPVYERTRPNGTVLEVRSVQLAGGGVVRTYTDVTERKTSERDLREARDRAEAASEVRTSFLATMSHEIRTPLNGIIGMSSILEQTDLNDDQHSYLRTIHGCGEALLEIINDVLDYSKLDSGMIELDATDVVLKEIVSSTVDILGARIHAKHLSLDVQMAPELPAVVHTDGSRIRQVLINLVGNSAKFTEEGGITIRVEAREGVLDVLPRLRFSVVDTGIGIPEESRDRLFREFSQVDASITRRFGGTGLGLAICKRIIEALDGEIGCDSSPGVGSTFWFEIPVRKVDGHVAEGKTGAVRANPLPAIQRSLRILLAEDNKVNQEVATLLLKRIGHEVVVADNGQQAVARAAECRYDLILMDMQMPEMGGVEATRAIRSGRGASRDAPIVGLTANAFASDRQACLDAGMDAFFAKPITRAKLDDALAVAGSDTVAENTSTAASDATMLINTEYRDMLFGEIGPDAGRALVQSFWGDAETIVEALHLAVSRGRSGCG